MNRSQRWNLRKLSKALEAVPGFPDPSESPWAGAEKEYGLQRYSGHIVWTIHELCHARTLRIDPSTDPRMNAGACLFHRGFGGG